MRRVFCDFQSHIFGGRLPGRVRAFGEQVCEQNVGHGHEPGPGGGRDKSR